MKDEKQLSFAKRKVEERKIMHGIEPKANGRANSEEKLH